MTEQRRAAQIWYPHVTLPAGSAQASPLVKAVRRITELFGLGDAGLKPNARPLSQCISYPSPPKEPVPLFRTEDIGKHFASSTGEHELVGEPPFLVLGTMAAEKAVAKSWDDLGLNIFDLPWGEDGRTVPKMFRYVPVTHVPALLAAFVQQQGDVAEWGPHADRAEKHLRIASCHEWIRECQQTFGHGSRDRMQLLPIDRVEKEIGELPPGPQKPVCTDDCGIARSLERETDGIDEGNLKLAIRRIANLDCQTHRLWPLLPVQLCGQPAYKRIIILEDDPGVRLHLEEQLEGMYPDAEVLVVDHDIWAEDWALVTADNDGGDEIAIKDKEAWETLFCVDLEISDKSKTHGAAGGLWFLYHVALKHPRSSRVVITGYRTQDERALNAGAAAFLLKPFADTELRRAIEAGQPFNVLWVCPEGVQHEWSVCANSMGKDFAWIKGQFRSWLQGRNIRLDTLPRVDSQTLGKYNVVLLDCLTIERRADEEDMVAQLADTYLQARNADSVSHIIVVLPMRDEFFRPGGILHALGNLLRDGQDAVFHKPMWFSTDSPQTTSLGQKIVDLIQDRPKFDAKYVAATPLVGTLWGQARHSRVWEPEGRNDESLPTSEVVVGWSPLGVFLGELYGFNVSLKSVTREGSFAGIAGVELSAKLDLERAQNPKRWQDISDASNAIVERFLAYLDETTNGIVPYVTVARWLRAVLNAEVRMQNREAEPGAEGGKGLTEFLTKLFGGETRFEFGVKGSWYDRRGDYVQDTPLVIEFCARRGVLAREAMERVIVGYLKKHGSEETVLFQEIPIRGFEQ